MFVHHLNRIRQWVAIVVTTIGVALCLDGTFTWADRPLLDEPFVGEGSSDVLPIGQDIDDYFQTAEAACNAICLRTVDAGSHTEPWQWLALPDGLLWHSYLAGPQEPRISSVLFRNQDRGDLWDATLGGRVGLLRYGTANAFNAQGWQWDLEGAVMTRLDLLHAEDVESMDYRFGTEITTRQGRWSAKFGYFHISSHVGDEYLIRNGTFQRINYVTESLVLGIRLQASEAVRIYGESAFAFRYSGGAQPWQFQTGIEYLPQIRDPRLGGPFFAPEPRHP